MYFVFNQIYSDKITYNFNLTDESMNKLKEYFKQTNIIYTLYNYSYLILKELKYK